MKLTGPDDALRCSFCHKSQEVVGKLFSAPSAYPRAYICDECILVCNTILQDDKLDPPLAAPANTALQQRWHAHALVDEVAPEKLGALIDGLGDLLKDREN
jgi:ATP-dependent protease Clp ATPase subunit